MKKFFLLTLLLVGCSDIENQNQSSEMTDNEEIHLKNEQLRKKTEEQINNIRNVAHQELEILKVSSKEIQSIITEIENKYAEFLTLSTKHSNGEISFDEYFKEGLTFPEEISKINLKIDLISIDGYMFDDIPNAIKEAKSQVNSMSNYYGKSIFAHLNIVLYKDYTNKDAFTFSENAREHHINAITVLKLIEDAYELSLK